MTDAVAEYGRHRLATDNWALGRFVVPFSRWTEFTAALAAADLPDYWSVSVIASPADEERLLAAGDDRAQIEAVECKVSSAREARQAAALTAEGFDIFVEPAALGAFDAIADALSGTGAAAKIRTGGVTADAFPSPAAVLRFLQACHRNGLRFKATAGLHHAVRGEYRLTYEPAPPVGEMFGFLNLAVAAALLWLNHEDAIVLNALGERSVDAFEFSDRGLAWRNIRLTRDQLIDVRTSFFTGFGSCSFQEPMSELGLEALPRR